MIIGINGKIGAGKDTVGTIIQGLLLTNNDQTYEIKKFAGKLKTVASILTGIPVKNFEDQEFKHSLLGPEWGTIRPNPLNSIPVFEDVQFNELMSIRELLQKLGTEAMRDGLHTNVWVNALFADYMPINIVGNVKPRKGGIKYLAEMPNWIITDMRFSNELKSVKERDGITIKVIRPHGYTNPHTHEYKEMPINFHPSETSLDKSKFDYEILNDGSMEKLAKKVRKILVKEKLI
jgi:hypothetical protein